MENSLRMLKSQTFQPTIIEHVNDVPLNDDVDITYRYRKGYERLRNKGLDVIALWENDDWYAPNYLETMVSEWVKAGKPDLLGTSYTIYYHLKLSAHFTMHHMERSSAMSTLIKPDLEFKWCNDFEPYTDIHLWNPNTGLKGMVFVPNTHLCLGMKHDVGKCGSFGHSTKKFFRYTEQDADKNFLKSIMDPESFDFYSNYFKNNI